MSQDSQNKKSTKQKIEVAECTKVILPNPLSMIFGNSNPKIIKVPIYFMGTEERYMELSEKHDPFLSSAIGNLTNKVSEENDKVDEFVFEEDEIIQEIISVVTEEINEQKTHLNERKNFIEALESHLLHLSKEKTSKEG